MKVIMAAAGTAGHINPALAIANKIKEKEPNSEIIFLGTERGLENDLVPRAGYKLEKIEAYGLSKKINLDNIKKMLKTLKGMKQAKQIVKEFKPDVIIGAGGYICGAAIMAGKKYKIPMLLHESNAFPGKAVKMSSKMVDEVLVSFEDAIQRLPKAKKVVLTGTPIKIKKIDLSENQKIEEINKLGLNPAIPIVLVFGGSQGAKKINETIVEIIKKKLNKKYQIILASGIKQYDYVKELLEKSNIDIEKIENVKIMPYIYNMEIMLNLADMVVCRSGAATIAEIATVGKPAIFVPLPNVSGDHQYYNAEVLNKAGAAEIIRNNELDENRLNKEIESIVSDKEKIKTMGDNAKKVETKNVEEKIYNEIIQILKNK